MFLAFMGHWGGPLLGIYSFNSVYGALGLDVCGFYGVLYCLWSVWVGCS